MIGFVTDELTAQAVSQAVADAQASRGLAEFWSILPTQISGGEHDGGFFIQADDELLNFPLNGNPVTHPSDYPEFDTLVASLGGLDARVDVPSEYLRKTAE